MVHARLKYCGETERGKRDRIALLVCPASETEKLVQVLSMINAEYPCYRFDNMSGDNETVEFFVQVADKEDFRDFSEVWKDYKKKV